MRVSKIFSRNRLAIITGFVFVLTLSTLIITPVQATSISNLVNFNNSSDLTSYFNSDSSPQFTNVTTGGIGNTGAINVPVGTDDIWTTKQGYSVAGAGDKYKFSAFFKIKENGGYGGLGFSDVDTNNTDEFGSPETGVGVMFHGGGGAFVNNRVNTNVSWIENVGDLVLGNWYKMIFEVTAKGSNSYDLKLQIFNSDENGVVGSLFTEQSLANVVNSDLGAASIIHGYFSAAGWRMEKIDNFQMDLEGGTSFIEVGLPVVLTGPVSNVTTTAASAAGTVTDEQSAAVSSKGICWSTNSSPTTANICTNNGSGLGAYSANISGLSAGTTYHLRAYATNSEGTSYGSESMFVTVGHPVTPTPVSTATPKPTTRPKSNNTSETDEPTPSPTASVTPIASAASTPTSYPTIVTLPKTGTIQLLVLDSDGLPIKNRQVTIDGKTYTTDGTGRINISVLGQGNYTVTVVVGGQTYSQEFSITSQTNGVVTVSMGQQAVNWAAYILGFLLLVIILVAGGYYLYKKRKRKNK